MRDLQTRIANKFQLTTDSFKSFFDAVDETFGADIDYGQVRKDFVDSQKGEGRYSPANIIKTSRRALIGRPVIPSISTSYIERQNLAIRMQLERPFTNAFSKKLQNLKAAISLHYYHYIFMRIHQTLRMTPAMCVGIAGSIFDWGELLA